LTAIAGDAFLLADGGAHEVGAKRAGLRRMRWLATSLLGTMLILLLTSAAYQPTHPWLHWVRAFAEAGAVGAMADWYAVVALFRHPLGLPILRSAIIPKNKDRIGESLGNFVQENFLTPENIVGKLKEHDTAKALARWLASPANGSQVAEAVGGLIPGILNALEDEDVRHLFDRVLTSELLKLDVSRIAGEVLAVLTEGNRHHALLDRGLSALEEWLMANRGLIKAKFSEASRYTPVFIDNYVVEKFVDGICALLHEVAANPRHEIRAQFEKVVRELIEQLKTSAEYRQNGEAVMREFVEHLRNESYYGHLWAEIRLRVEADVAGSDSLIREHIAGALVAIGKGLLAEPALRQKLNAWWLDTVEKMVLRYRHQISGLITDVVKSWDAKEVSEKVELEIGKDLQFIRINGTLVGGTVGVVLHTLTYLIA